MSEIRCPQCRREGLVNFERRTVYLQVGPALDVIACRNCSYWLKSRPLAAIPVAPRKVSSPAEASPPKRRRTYKAFELCPIRGCGERFNPTINEFGLCQTHSKGLRKWALSCRVTPPPMTRVNGLWVKRGEPLPGIPGEKPVGLGPSPEPKNPPTPRAIARRPRRPRRPEGGAKLVPIVQPNYEAEISRLARLGNGAARTLLAALEA